VARNRPPQPQHLTLIELVLSYALFAGVGYWAAGALGAWIGAGLVTACYVYRIWQAISAPAAGPSTGVVADGQPATVQDGEGTT
jgi:hypothetical protein